MRLTEGLYKDILKEDQPEGTSPEIWNMVKNKRNGAFSNEPGFMPVFSFHDSRKILGSVSAYNASIIFSKGADFDEIGILDKGKSYKAIISSPLLNFPVHTSFKGIVYLNDDAERIVVWTDKVNSLRYLNVDNPIIQNGEELTSKVIERLSFFPNYTLPTISSIQVNSTGGVFLSGTYFFSIKLRTKDGFVTNYSTISKPVVITKSNTSLPRQFEGDKGGVTTSKSVSLDLSALDTSFQDYYVGMLGYVNGELQARELGPYAINTSKLTIPSWEKATPILVENITIPSTVFKKIESLALHDDRIYVAGLEFNKQVDCRAAANKIQVDWVYEDAVNFDTTDGYRDGGELYLKTGFMPGEVLSLYASYVLNDGTKLPAANIPGRRVDHIVEHPDHLENALLHEISADDYSNEIAIGDDVKYFHTQETAKSDGTLGYWENEDTYPTDYPDFAGEKIRHHKLPFLASLNKWKNSFVYDVEENNFFIGVDFDGSDNTSILDKGEGKVSVTEVNGKTRVTALQEVKLIVNTRVHSRGSFDKTITVKSYAGTTIYTKTTSEIKSFTDNRTVTLSEGEWIEVESSRESSAPATGFYGGVYIFPSYYIGEERPGDLHGKVLGLKLSNITIPEELQGKVQRVEFFYAKRDFSNSTVLSQGFLFEENQEGKDNLYGKGISNTRFHGFELLVNEGYPAIPVSHIRKEYGVFNPEDYFKVEGKNLICRQLNEETIGIDQYMYQPYSAEFKKETAFKMKLKDSVNLDYNYGTVVTLMSHKKSIYTPIDLQDLVYTGSFIDLSTAADVSGAFDSPTTTYGGDTYFCDYGFRVLPEHNEDGDFVESGSFLVPVYSPYNINLRYGSDARNELYIPKNALPNDFEIDEDAEPDISGDDFDNFVQINTDYNKLSDLNAVYPRKGDEDYLDKTPNTIAMGEPFTNEGQEDNLKVFKPLNYHVLGKDSGKITNIESTQGGIIIHTEYSIYKTSGRLKLGSTEESITIGDGDIFDVKPQALIKTKTGYAGTQHASSILSFVGGYFFIEHDTGKLFLIREALQEISNNGLRQFFKENSSFFLKEQFEKEGITIPDQNPGVLIGYTAVFDSDYKRIIFTKRDYEITDQQLVHDGRYRYADGGLEKYHDDTNQYIPVNPDNDVYIKSKGYTLTIDISTGKFISQHTYIPEAALYDRSGVFSIQDSKIYRHNVGKPGVFYKETPERSWADFIINDGKTYTKLLSSLSWITRTEAGNGYTGNPTYTHIAVFNEHQCSGEVALDGNHLSANKNLSFVQGQYNFNSFKDLTRNENDPILLEDSTINKNNIDYTKKWYNQKRFISKVITVRGIIDNIGGYFVYLLDLMPKLKQSDR